VKISAYETANVLPSSLRRNVFSWPSFALRVIFQLFFSRSGTASVSGRADIRRNRHHKSICRLTRDSCSWSSSSDIFMNSIIVYVQPKLDVFNKRIQSHTELLSRRPDLHVYAHNAGLLSLHGLHITVIVIMRTKWLCRLFDTHFRWQTLHSMKLTLRQWQRQIWMRGSFSRCSSLVFLLDGLLLQTMSAYEQHDGQEEELSLSVKSVSLSFRLLTPAYEYHSISTCTSCHSTLCLFAILTFILTWYRWLTGPHPLQDIKMST